MQGIRALVVDDDEDSLELLREVLGGAGATVLGVTSAAEAEEALVREPYDIIVSDIGMPHMDGYALMRRVRTRGDWRAIPSIALTAYARGEDAARAVEAGFQEHLAKPVDAHELVLAVARWTDGIRA